jgi:hypothetical protein
MVGHEIQDQMHASPGEFSSGYGETARTTQVLINHVTSHAIRRTYVIAQTKISQSSAKILQQDVVSIRNGSAGRTTLPDSHEPHSIEAMFSDSIPLR